MATNTPAGNSAPVEDWDDWVWVEVIDALIYHPVPKAEGLEIEFSINILQPLTLDCLSVALDRVLSQPEEVFSPPHSTFLKLEEVKEIAENLEGPGISKQLTQVPPVDFAETKTQIDFDFESSETQSSIRSMSPEKQIEAVVRLPKKELGNGDKKTRISFDNEAPKGKRLGLAASRWADQQPEPDIINALPNTETRFVLVEQEQKKPQKPFTSNYLQGHKGLKGLSSSRWA
jgi:hypothetical protein